MKRVWASIVACLLFIVACPLVVGLALFYITKERALALLKSNEEKYRHD